jgi:hypothetical protein
MTRIHTGRTGRFADVTMPFSMLTRRRPGGERGERRDVR